MTPKAVFDALTILFSPSGLVSLSTQLLLWCAFSGAVYISVEWAFGIRVNLARDLMVIWLTTAPLVIAFLLIFRHFHIQHQELIKTASTDSMTALMNRQAFFEAVEVAPLGALLVVDVDHFKAVNDRYGHTVGDNVLIAVANHLRANIRESDLIGRVGGEEFGIFIFGEDSQYVDQIGERMCNGCVVYDVDMTAPVKVTMSIGVAYAEMAPDIPELYRRADEALFQAKRSGRACLIFWQPTVNASR